jgi:hypothetical protein
MLPIRLQRFGVVPDGLTDVAVLHVGLAQTVVPVGRFYEDPGILSERLFRCMALGR